jgi:hypothetical protein
MPGVTARIRAMNSKAAAAVLVLMAEDQEEVFTFCFDGGLVYSCDHPGS